MKQYILFIILVIGFSLSLYAYQFKFDGMAANKYPIVIEVDRNANGSISGRYAYKSTLRKQSREKSSSWLYIRPDGNSKSNYIITDSQGNVQEYWSNAAFWREGGVNYFDASVVNAKGSSFGISAYSASKNTSTWAGSYDINSDGYRNCPPPITVRLTLNDNGTNTYKGSWSMKLAGDDINDSGMLVGNVTGEVSNGMITLTLKTYNCLEGKYESYFNSGSDCSPRLTEGSVIAKISKSGSSYKIQPVGKMKECLTDLGGILSIVKIK